MRKKKLIERIKFKHMSSFVLKLIAVFTMACDHFSYLIFGKFSFLNLIGRIAFPIFAYQITEGYIHTSNLKKYFLRLLLFALISQIPFMLFLSTFTNPWHLNIFFTLTFGLLAITVYDKLNKLECKNIAKHRLYQLLGFVAFILLAAIAEFAKCDYGYFGVLIIFCFYFFRNHKILMNLSFIACVIQFYSFYLLFDKSFTYLAIAIFTIIPLIFINLYNHKKGKDTKYFLYLFYPLHFLVIYALNLLLK